LRLIEILENFTNENSNEDEVESEDNESEEELSDIDDGSDKEVFQLHNPKIRQGKGRPAGTRRYKASHEKEGGSKPKQRRNCKKCGQLEHYQKNCSLIK
jgi:hypothetical protein